MNKAARTSGDELRLDANVDPSLISSIFQRFGRVHITRILAPQSATRVFTALSKETPWSFALRDEAGDRNLDVSSLEELDPVARAALAASIDRTATAGFAYRYSNFRLDDHYIAGMHRELFLMSFYEFINSPPFLDFARAVTGVPEIAYADAQATLYRKGDFLTAHDDAVEGKNRHAAYVFNFTPGWRTDWGGLLAFPDEHGHLHEAFVPAFNALNLMRVPTMHLVTQVASYAGGGRYSITGRLRSR